jgi:hypothetical protein
MAQLQQTGITGSLDVDGTTNARNYTLKHNNLGAISGTTTINITSGSYVSGVINGQTFFEFSGAPNNSKSTSFILELENAALFAITWPESVQWESSTAPTLSYTTTPFFSTYDILVFTTDDGGQTWRGSLSIRSAKPAPI